MSWRKRSCLRRTNIASDKHIQLEQRWSKRSYAGPPLECFLYMYVHQKRVKAPSEGSSDTQVGKNKHRCWCRPSRRLLEMTNVPPGRGFHLCLTDFKGWMWRSSVFFLSSTNPIRLQPPTISESASRLFDFSLISGVGPWWGQKFLSVESVFKWLYFFCHWLSWNWKLLICL